MLGLQVPTEPSEPSEPILDLQDGLGWADWAQAGLILIGGIAVALVVYRLLLRGIRRAGSEGVARFVARFAAAFIVGTGIFYSLSSLGVRLAPLLGVVGVGGIALAFALQDLVENLISGVVLQSTKNLSIGDQISTNDYEGTIVDINFRSTRLRTYDGRLVMIPNSMVVKNPLENRTAYDLRRTTLVVGVAYATDLDTAQSALKGAVDGIDQVASVPPPEVWVEAFGSSSIDFAVRFWHRPQIAVEWQVRSEVAMAVKRSLDAAGIEIPFPQRVLHWRDD